MRQVGPARQVDMKAAHRVSLAARSVFPVLPCRPHLPFRPILRLQPVRQPRRERSRRAASSRRTISACSRRPIATVAEARSDHGRARIAEGVVVADLGAGGGWFTVQLARRVGPNGLVYAEDIQPQMIEAISRRVQRENLTNVRTVLGTPTIRGCRQASTPCSSSTCITRWTIAVERSCC